MLVRVHAASVGPWVWRMIRPDPLIMRLVGFALFKPKRTVPGADLAGRVEAVGRSVTRFRPGDDVYGEAEATFAEYTSAPESRLAPMPTNLTYEQAAAVPIAASTALLGLRDHGRLQPGRRVLIIGASGGVGTFAVQIGKALGAEVTGVCSTGSIDTVRALGAEQVIDYTAQDFSTSGDRYDVIFQLAGTQSPSQLRRSLTREGTLVLSSGEGGRLIGPIGRIIRASMLSPFVSQRLRSFYASPSFDDLLDLTAYIEAGDVKPVIDRSYPLSDAPEAIRSAEEDHVRGKIVITI